MLYKKLNCLYYIVLFVVLMNCCWAADVYNPQDKVPVSVKSDKMPQSVKLLGSCVVGCASTLIIKNFTDKDISNSSSSVVSDNSSIVVDNEIENYQLKCKDKEILTLQSQMKSIKKKNQECFQTNKELQDDLDRLKQQIAQERVEHEKKETCKLTSCTEACKFANSTDPHDITFNDLKKRLIESLGQNKQLALAKNNLQEELKETLRVKIEENKLCVENLRATREVMSQLKCENQALQDKCSNLIYQNNELSVANNEGRNEFSLGVY